MDQPSNSKGSIVTRFAPSPTGDLHLGHVFAAKFARDFAHQHGGRFILRFEDIDHTRVRPEFYQRIRDDLEWLGLTPDEEVPWQSQRLHHYRQALEQLKSLGLVYPCFCKRREILAQQQAIASAPHHPPTNHYPGTCRQLTPRQAIQRLASGEPAAWRLDIAKACNHIGPLFATDLRLGQLQIDASTLDDVVLARKDIETSYHLAVVVDDAAQGITHVTRGEDLWSATPYHRLLQALLNLPTPIWIHHSLITDQHGQRLATRNQSLSIHKLRSAGETPASLIAMLPQTQKSDQPSTDEQ